MTCLTNQQGHRSHQHRPHHRWLGSGKAEKQQQRRGRQGKPQARRPVAAVEQHRAADQPTASMDAAALRCSRPAADSNCLGGLDVLPIPATAGVPLAADVSAPLWPGHASPAAGVQGTQATAARFAPQPREPQPDPPPTDRNNPRENGAHRQASDR